MVLLKEGRYLYLRVKQRDPDFGKLHIHDAIGASPLEYLGAFGFLLVQFRDDRGRILVS